MTTGDHVIDGDWWLDAASEETPYMRETGEWRNQQINTSAAPGEQALNGWWRKSQDSYHLGTGIKYFETAADPQVGYRFADSAGVNVWEPGQLTLLRSTRLARAHSGRASMIGYSTSNSNGVLLGQFTEVTQITQTGQAAVPWGGGGTITDMASNGGSYFILATDGIHRGTLPAGAGTKMYNGPIMSTTARLACVKDRLVMTLDNTVRVMGASAAAGSALPAPQFTHDDSGWVWSDIAETPDGILLSGYLNDQSRIYFMGIGGTAEAPEIQPPRAVAELGKGEAVLCMYVYAGSLLIVGTTLGWRAAAIGQSGNLTMGPLTQTDGPVHAATGMGDYVYVSGANVDGYQGLYRISLGNVLNDTQSYSQFGSLRFPMAKDIKAGTVEFSVGHVTRGLAPVGMTARLAFTVDEYGCIMEYPDTLEPYGWVQSGRVRFDTTESKIFAFGRVLHGSGAGRVEIDWLDEKGVATTAVPEYSTSGVSDVRFIIDHTKPHPFVSLKLHLLAEANVSPVVGEWSIKAQPSAVKQRVIRLALQCQSVEQPAGGRPVQRPVWERLRKLEAAESVGRIVEYRNRGTGEAVFCIIDSLQFARTAIPSGPFEKQDPGGVLMVTLRTVD